MMSSKPDKPKPLSPEERERFWRGMPWPIDEVPEAYVSRYEATVCDLEAQLAARDAALGEVQKLLEGATRLLTKLAGAILLVPGGQQLARDTADASNAIDDWLELQKGEAYGE